MANLSKGTKERLFHITRRNFPKKWMAYLIRFGAFAVAILICAIVSAIVSDRGFGMFFYDLFDGAFGTERRIWDLFHNTALLLLIALAVTPAFKMRFWNIGAEGQVLIGALACSAVIQYLGGKLPNAALIPLMILAGIAGGVVWSVIPAIFKARWNTNETLFTLMMNYLATCFTAFCIASWAPKGSGTLTFKTGFLPELGNQFVLKILVAVVLMVFLFVYLRYSKHGYELSVVGESERTAQYIGINVRKVIIRTMILCGILCGIAGVLLVAGTHHAIHKTDTVAGRGFTAILVSWLAKFNPLTMGFTAFLVVFIQKGTGQYATLGGLGSAYSDVMTGIFFILIISCEFFINYRIVFRHFADKKKSAPVEIPVSSEPETKPVLTTPEGSDPPPSEEIVEPVAEEGKIDKKEDEE